MASAPQGVEDELGFEELEREMARFGLRERSEVEAEGRRQEDVPAAEPGESFVPVVLEQRSLQRYLEQVIPGDTVQEVGLLPQPFSSPRMFFDRRLLDEWRFRGDHISGDHYFAPHNFPDAGSVPPHAAWPRVLPTCAYVALPPAWPWRAAAVNGQVEDHILYLAKNEQMVLGTLLCGPPEASEAVEEVLVWYAVPLMESRHGKRLLDLVLNSCGHGLRDSIFARITRDKKVFSKICAERSDEVVRMIRSCTSLESFQLLRNAIKLWMAPLMIDSNRLRVVQAFVQCAPPYFAEFIFNAVAKNCVALACCPHGVCLLQYCLEHVKVTEKDNIFTEISCWSINLAQNRYGNYIVQDVLKRRDPSHLAVISSCFRNNYVELSRQRYSSNVVETCLEVFDDVERFVIVDELIWYPRFRDLVAHEFANYVIFKALKTCKVTLRHRLATAILSLPNVKDRHPHCLRIFNKLSQLGYML